MTFEIVNISEVNKDLLDKFDSGNYNFNNFLVSDARHWQDCGESVTYVFVDSDESPEKKYTAIHGYFSLNTCGLYATNSEDRCLSCIEIRMFAIARQLRKRHDPTIPWSDIIFKTLLQHIYYISTHIIGCRAIFLYANHDGYELYKANGFREVNEYLVPEDNKLDVNECTPMVLFIDDDMIYNIFT